MLLSMLAYSAGAIYFARTKWNGLHILVINGWQTLTGGLFLVPVLLFTYHEQLNQFDLRFWGGVLWLAVPVSVAASWQPARTKYQASKIDLRHATAASGPNSGVSQPAQNVRRNLRAGCTAASSRFRAPDARAAHI